MARPVHANTFTVTGQDLPVAESVGRFSVSQNGALAYMAGGPFPVRSCSGSILERQAARRCGSGCSLQLRPIVSGREADLHSPDPGRRVVTTCGYWIWCEACLPPSRPIPRWTILQNWSHDGRRIVWVSRRSGTVDLYTKAASGTGQEEKLITIGTVSGWATDWSLDGKFVLYQRPGAKTGTDLWIAPQSTGASGEPQTPFPYLDSPFVENDRGVLAGWALDRGRIQRVRPAGQST